MIALTVALPLYNAKKIAWLAMESLCRQECVDFHWELIVCEEDNHLPFTQSRVESYTERLAAVGCVRIKYISQPQWIPLAQKWRIIANDMSTTSEVFLLQAGDCYAHPMRLKNALELMRDGGDWVQQKLGIFYDPKMNVKALYDHDTVGPEFKTALNMSIKAKWVRALPASKLSRGIDGWLFRCATAKKGSALVVKWDESDAWRRGCDTHGYNNISAKRGRNMKACEAPFRRAFSLRMVDVLPEDILEKLKKL